MGFGHPSSHLILLSRVSNIRLFLLLISSCQMKLSWLVVLAQFHPSARYSEQSLVREKFKERLDRMSERVFIFAVRVCLRASCVKLFIDIRAL